MTDEADRQDPASKPLHRALGLTDDEFSSIVSVLGRQPNELELAMYSVMWSEHCSYKSSRVHLSRLPTSGPRVLVGPGENAGVVDAGDGVAIALRIESHNHPSFVEPFQGAATGVGGILRDIFTMGARPIALMDPLFVGPLDDAHSRYLLDGIVRGVASYGNSVGVPTVGGQITFDPSYRANPLVNVFCLGVLPVGRLVLASASGVGNVAVLLGASTGRDGIGGVSVLASAGFTGSEDAEKRPSVQVGDPYEEKRLLEACLELLDAGLVVGIQDLGGAGLTCATCETAARAGLGIDVDVSAVPRREEAMTPVEVMTSESQERMLAIVEPARLPELRAICRRWQVEASVVGVVTAPGPDGRGLLRVRDGVDGPLLAEVPAASLADDAPRYDRPRAAPADLAARQAADPGLSLPPEDAGADLLALLVDPSWIYRQYDHELYLNTVRGPGAGPATVLRLAGPGVAFAGKAMALSCDANPGWCRLDPRRGAAATVAESLLNVSAAGAEGICLVNCLNFGNPEHPEVMWELSESIDGLAEACRDLSLPVVGGNVSLYNESEGTDIDPTPVVAVLGLIGELVRRPPGHGVREGDGLVLLGPDHGGLAGSRWARQVRARRDGGRPPALDAGAHLALCALVARLVAAEAGGAEAAGLVSGLHVVGDGGLAVALAESALASGVGARVGDPGGHEGLFSELPLRVLVSSGRPDELVAAAEAAGVPARRIGTAGGDRLAVEGLVDLGLSEVAAAFSGRIPAALGELAAH